MVLQQARKSGPFNRVLAPYPNSRGDNIIHQCSVSSRAVTEGRRGWRAGTKKQMIATSEARALERQSRPYLPQKHLLRWGVLDCRGSKATAVTGAGGSVLDGEGPVVFALVRGRREAAPRRLLGAVAKVGRLAGPAAGVAVWAGLARPGAVVLVGVHAGAAVELGLAGEGGVVVFHVVKGIHIWVGSEG